MGLLTLGGIGYDRQYQSGRPPAQGTRRDANKLVARVSIMTRVIMMILLGIGVYDYNDRKYDDYNG